MNEWKKRGVSLREDGCRAKVAGDCFAAGSAYQIGGDSIPQNTKRATELFRNGCDLDDRSSCCWLAQALDSTDPKVAEPLWEKGGGRSKCFPVMQ
jgi:hypothetical protein